MSRRVSNACDASCFCCDDSVTILQHDCETFPLEILQTTVTFSPCPQMHSPIVLLDPC